MQTVSPFTKSRTCCVYTLLTHGTIFRLRMSNFSVSSCRFFPAKCWHVPQVIFSTVWNIYLTSHPWILDVVVVISCLKCSFTQKSCYAGGFGFSLCCHTQSNGGEFLVRCWLDGWIDGFVRYVCVCRCTATLQLLPPPPSHSISCVAHERMKIILHYSVGTWKLTFSWGDNKSNYFRKISPLICYQNKLHLTMQHKSPIWIHMKKTSLIH